MRRFAQTCVYSGKLTQSHTDSYNLAQTPAILCRFAQTPANSYRFEQARADLCILKKTDRSKSKKMSDAKKANTRLGIYRKSLCVPKQLDFQGRIAARNFSTII